MSRTLVKRPPLSPSAELLDDLSRSESNRSDLMRNRWIGRKNVNWKAPYFMGKSMVSPIWEKWRFLVSIFPAIHWEKNLQVLGQEAHGQEADALLQSQRANEHCPGAVIFRKIDLQMRWEEIQVEVAKFGIPIILTESLVQWVCLLILSIKNNYIVRVFCWTQFWTIRKKNKTIYII